MSLGLVAPSAPGPQVSGFALPTQGVTHGSTEVDEPYEVCEGPMGQERGVKVI